MPTFKKKGTMSKEMNSANVFYCYTYFAICMEKIRSIKGICLDPPTPVYINMSYMIHNL